MVVAKISTTDSTANRYRVLVVDDERDMVNQIKLRFEYEGFEVLEAYNGRDARKICDSAEPDVVITDIRMPVSGGDEFLRNLYQGNPVNHDLPIVICISGYSDLDMGDAYEAGASAFFAKPVDPGDLVAASRTFIRKKEVFQALKGEAIKLKRDADESQQHLDQVGIQYMHELKNHVTAIVSILQRVLMPSNATATLSEPRLRTLVEKASRKGWELNEIIKTVYATYSTEGVTVSTVAIGEVLQAAIVFFQDYVDANGVVLSFDSGPKDFFVKCPSSSVRQILYNLVKNATEAMTGQAIKRIRVAVRRDQRFGYIDIHDGGSGIPEDLWEAMVAPRFSTKSGNLGIGLSFCSRAAETFGGAIKLEKSDSGARISLAIPLAGPGTFVDTNKKT